MPLPTDDDGALGPPPPPAPAVAPPPAAGAPPTAVRDEVLRPRMLLAAALCLVSATMLAPEIQAASAARHDDLETAAWMAVVFLALGGACCALRARFAAGAVLVLTLLATNYLAVEPPRLFRPSDIIWGTTPPLLLAIYHLARSATPVEGLTVLGAGAWVVGFALKFLQARAFHF